MCTTRGERRLISIPGARRNAWKASWSLDNLIKIYHVVQELWAFSTDGQTDSHSDYSAHLLVVQYALASIYLNNLYRLGLFQMITCGGGGKAVEFFGKASSSFCIPVARQC